MPLRYLLDENLRGPWWNAIQRHNSFGTNTIDAVRVGDPVRPSFASEGRHDFDLG